MAVAYRSTSTARVIYAITSVVVGLIVVGILLVLLGANPGNVLVNFFLDVARWLTTPFHKGGWLFNPAEYKAKVLVNYGLAALVYGLIGSALARLGRG